jgi:hypothetical protein
MHGIQSSVTVINRLPSQVGGSDRLEDDPSNRQVNPIYGHEGIALWIDSTRIDSDVRRSFRDEDFDQRLVRMTFMRPTFREGVTAIELRPANTLFVNGNQSTMFQDSWEVNPFIGRKLTRISSREPLKTLEIFVPSDAPDFSAPIEALTGRREILSSMGNIISQLKSQKDGKPVPASAELEEKVPQYLARRRETGGALVVFALVSPTGLVNSSELDGLVQPSRGNVIEADMSLLRRALLAGAHLHRVTSGGGGWGKKQGLLSLDPDFDFEKHEDTGSLNAMLEGRGSRGRASSTNAVSPGDYVQFFASYEPEQQVLQNLDSPNIKDIDTSDWDGMKWIELAQPHNTIFGSLPSQDDFFMPLQDCKGPASRIIGIPGQFGMLSAGGTCLRRWKFERIHTRPDLGAIESEGDRGKLNQVAISRMDIPYGFWSIQSVNRLQRPPPKIRRVRVPARSEEQHSQSSSPQTSPA